MKYLRFGLLGLLCAILSLVQAQEAPDLNTIQRMAAGGNRNQAIDALNKRIGANPGDVEAAFLKGVLLLQQGDKSGAREVFLDISRRFPRLPEAYNNLAAIHAADGEYELARQTLLSAIANTPDYAPVRANLGDLYIKMAMDAYREALKLNPNDASTQARLKALEQLFQVER
ncbi:MAG: tetratricopeptide repeat protein [Candidatus Competibacteraceae bacterium]